MSNEEINEKIRQLNANKDNVITHFTDYLSHAKKIADQTKDKKIAEAMLLNLKSVEKATTTNKKDIQPMNPEDDKKPEEKKPENEEHKPDSEPSVIIEVPVYDKNKNIIPHYDIGKDILLKFKTTGIITKQKPVFAYYIKGINNTSKEEPFLFTKGIKDSNTAVVEIGNIKREETTALSEGMYTIEVHIVDPIGHIIDIVPYASVIIQVGVKASGSVVPTSTPKSENQILILHPNRYDLPFRTDAKININLKTDGPYYTGKKKYWFIIIIEGPKPLREQTVLHNYLTSQETINSNFKLSKEGEYTIYVLTYEVTPEGNRSNKLISNNRETFTVKNYLKDYQTGPKGLSPSTSTAQHIPNNVIDNIIINREFDLNHNHTMTIKDVNLPFMMPLKIFFDLSKANTSTFLTVLKYISIKITQDGSSEVIFSKNNDYFERNEYELKYDGHPAEIPFIKDGKYFMQIIIKLADESIIYNTVVPIEISPKQVQPRILPKPLIMLDNNEVLGISGIKDKNNHVIRISNEGSGKLGWNILYSPQAKISKSSKMGKSSRISSPLEGELQTKEHQEIVFNATGLSKPNAVNTIIIITSNGRKGKEISRSIIKLE